MYNTVHMNPNSSNEIPSLNLPPVMEQDSVQQPAETIPSMPELVSQPPIGIPTQVAAPAAIQVADQPQTQVQPTNDEVTYTSVNDVPNTAEDADLIEKEWVSKAKQIVEKTHDDPYQQSKELAHIKVEYVQKRFNKALKTGE